MCSIGLNWIPEPLEKSQWRYPVQVLFCFRFVTMYLSYSPCASCADIIIEFSTSRPQCQLSVGFSCLFRHEEDRHRDGLRRLNAAPRIFLGVFTGTFFDNYTAVECLTHSVTDWIIMNYWGLVVILDVLVVNSLLVVNGLLAAISLLVVNSLLAANSLLVVNRLLVVNSFQLCETTLHIHLQSSRSIK